MSSVDVLGTDGKKAGSADLPVEIFDVQINVPLMHQVVVAQLAAARRGTHSTKTRGEVSGGGAKPYRQKGTGRARQGSTRAPQFTGGGVVFGPKPRDYSQRTPKKMKAAALRAALSDRARGGRVHVLSGLVDGGVPSTKTALAALASLPLGRHVLVVVQRTDELGWKSLRNASAVHLIDPGQLNTYDVLVSDDIVFTEAALAVFVAGGPKGKSVKASATSTELAEPAAEPVKPKAAKAAEPVKPKAAKAKSDVPKADVAKADAVEAVEPVKPKAVKAKPPVDESSPADKTEPVDETVLDETALDETAKGDHA